MSKFCFLGPPMTQIWNQRLPCDSYIPLFLSVGTLILTNPSISTLFSSLPLQTSTINEGNSDSRKEEIEIQQDAVGDAGGSVFEGNQMETRGSQAQVPSSSHTPSRVHWDAGTQGVMSNEFRRIVAVACVQAIARKAGRAVESTGLELRIAPSLHPQPSEEGRTWTKSPRPKEHDTLLKIEYKLFRSNIFYSLFYFIFHISFPLLLQTPRSKRAGAHSVPQASFFSSIVH